MRDLIDKLTKINEMDLPDIDFDAADREFEKSRGEVTGRFKSEKEAVRSAQNELSGEEFGSVKIFKLSDGTYDAVNAQDFVRLGHINDNGETMLGMVSTTWDGKTEYKKR